jgi:hypothetical protein
MVSIWRAADCRIHWLRNASDIRLPLIVLNTIKWIWLLTMSDEVLHLVVVVG